MAKRNSTFYFNYFVSSNQTFCIFDEKIILPHNYERI